MKTAKFFLFSALCLFFTFNINAKQSRTKKPELLNQDIMPISDTNSFTAWTDNHGFDEPLTGIHKTNAPSKIANPKNVKKQLSDLQKRLNQMSKDIQKISENIQ